MKDLLNWVIGLGAFFSFLAAGWLKAKHTGRKEERQKQEARDKAAVEKAKEVAEDVDALDDDDLLDRARQWLR